MNVFNIMAMEQSYVYYRGYKDCVKPLKILGVIQVYTRQKIKGCAYQCTKARKIIKWVCTRARKMQKKLTESCRMDFAGIFIKSERAQQCWALSSYQQTREIVPGHQTFDTIARLLRYFQKGVHFLFRVVHQCIKAAKEN